MSISQYVYNKNCFFFPYSWLFFWAPDNLNVFWFPLKVRVIGSWLYIKIWLTTGNPNNSLFCTQFSPLSTRNCVWGLCNLNIVWGSILPDTAWKRGLLQAPCWHSQLLHSNLLVTSILIQTPASTARMDTLPATLYGKVQLQPQKYRRDMYSVTYKRLALSSDKMRKA